MRAHLVAADVAVVAVDHADMSEPRVAAVAIDAACERASCCSCRNKLERRCYLQHHLLEHRDEGTEERA